MFPTAETGFDPQAAGDIYSNCGQPRDLRHAVQVRLPRAAAQADPEHRGRAARDERRRQAVDDPHQAGHLLRRRPGVQGPEARAHGVRLRVLVEARDGPAHAQQLDADVRRALRGHGRARQRHEGGRQVRLRQVDRRTAGDRPLHDPDEAQLPGHRDDVQPDDDRLGRGRARGRRGVRRRQRLGDGEPGRHRPVQAEGMAARPAHRARGEPELPRRAFPRQQRSCRQGAGREVQRASASRSPAASRSASSRRATRACSRSSRARSTTRARRSTSSGT